jgi:micrococcal nuclease
MEHLKYFFRSCFSRKQSGEFDEVHMLLNATYVNTNPFVPLITKGKVIKVYDGDTITVASKLPYPGAPFQRFSVRLRGVDSPEIKTHSFDEKQAAIKSRDALHELIYGKIVILQNVSTEKYGRVLADVYIDDIFVNRWLLDNHYAITYDGGKKVSFVSE